MNCEICKKQIILQEDASVSCRKCDLNFHTTCTGIISPKEIKWLTIKGTKWMCPRCTFGAFELVDGVNEQLNLLANESKSMSEKYQNMFEKINTMSTTFEENINRISAHIAEIEMKISNAFGVLQGQIDELRTNPQCSCNNAIELLKQEIEEL